MNAFKPRETLTEQVARHIENLIAFGQLRSGERIYEGAMAKQMDVSHGSIREGLLLLEKRHLVRNVPRKGAFVTPLDEYFVRSLYETLELYLTHTQITDAGCATLAAALAAGALPALKELYMLDIPASAAAKAAVYAARANLQGEYTMF